MIINFRAIIIGSLWVLILSGCSSKYPVTFDSNPKGASLVCNGTNWGYTPKTLYYDARVKKLNSLDVSRCSANWVSGFKKDYGSVPPRQYPNGVITTIERPSGDGYSTDAQFALQVQNSNYQRRQAKAAEDSAYQQSRNANANQQQAYQLQQQNFQQQQQDYRLNRYIRYGY